MEDESIQRIRSVQLTHALGVQKPLNVSARPACSDCGEQVPTDLFAPGVARENVVRALDVHKFADQVAEPAEVLFGETQVCADEVEFLSVRGAEAGEAVGRDHEAGAAGGWGTASWHL